MNLGKRPDGEPVLYTHTSSESRCPKCDHAHGPRWWAARSWLHWYGTGPTSKHRELSAEWYLFTRANDRLGISFEVGGGENESGFNAFIGVPFLFKLYVGAEGFLPFLCRKVKGHWQTYNRELELSYCFRRDHAAWGDLAWNVWTEPDCWDRKTPRWRRGRFDPCSFVLGAQVYTSTPISCCPGYVQMPEQRYPVRVQIEECVWKRPRWPFPIRRIDATVDVADGGCVPIPGKGENSWDCGEDGVYSSGFSHCPSAQDAVERFAASILKRRQQYGGEDWRPSVKPPKETATA